MLQRSTDSNDDFGIYLEFCDQINSGYNLISECRISDEKISIDLKGSMDGLIEGFDVEFTNSDSIKKDLCRVFRGQEDKLK